MTEIKSYGRPPTLVETVMQAVMTLLGKEPTWAEAKRQLGEGQQEAVQNLGTIKSLRKMTKKIL